MDDEKFKILVGKISDNLLASFGDSLEEYSPFTKGEVECSSLLALIISSYMTALYTMVKVVREHTKGTEMITMIDNFGEELFKFLEKVKFKIELFKYQ